MEIIQEMMAHSRLASPEFIEMVERAVNMQAQWETAMSPLHKHLDIMQKIKGMDSQQLQELASIVSSPGTIAAIQPALDYIEKERPDLYQELQKPIRDAGMDKAPQYKKKCSHRRTRTSQKASRFVLRSDANRSRAYRKLLSMSSTRLSFLLTALGNLGDAMPPELEHSVHVLVFVLTILLIINYECHNHDNDTK